MISTVCHSIILEHLKISTVFDGLRSDMGDEFALENQSVSYVINLKQLNNLGFLE